MMDAETFRGILDQIPSWDDLESYVIIQRNNLVRELMYSTDLPESRMREIIGELRGLDLILSTPEYFERDKRLQRELEEEDES